MLATCSKFFNGLRLLEIWLALHDGVSSLNPCSEYMLLAKSFYISYVCLSTPTSDDGVIVCWNHAQSHQVSITSRMVSALRDTGVGFCCCHSNPVPRCDYKSICCVVILMPSRIGFVQCNGEGGKSKQIFYASIVF